MNKVGISKFVSWVPGFLILQGLVYLVIYYLPFNVPIQNFVELSEILTAFTTKLFSLIITIIFCVILIAFYENKEKDKEIESKKLDVKHEIESEKGKIGTLKTRFKKILRWLTITRIYYITSISAPLILLIFAWVGGTPIDKWYINSIVFMFLMPIITFLIGKIINLHVYSDAEVFKDLTASVIVFILMTISTYILTIREAYLVHEKGANFGVKVVLTDGIVLMSDSNSFYIGKTNKYLFYYKKIEKTTEVIKMDDIKRIIFPVK